MLNRICPWLQFKAAAASYVDLGEFVRFGEHPSQLARIPPVKRLRYIKIVLCRDPEAEFVDRIRAKRPYIGKLSSNTATSGGIAVHRARAYTQLRTTRFGIKFCCCEPICWEDVVIRAPEIRPTRRVGRQIVIVVIRSYAAGYSWVGDVGLRIIGFHCHSDGVDHVGGNLIPIPVFICKRCPAQHRAVWRLKYHLRRRVIDSRLSGEIPAEHGCCRDRCKTSGAAIVLGPVVVPEEE